MRIVPCNILAFDHRYLIALPYILSARSTEQSGDKSSMIDDKTCIAEWGWTESKRDVVTLFVFCILYFVFENGLKMIKRELKEYILNTVQYF